MRTLSLLQLAILAALIGSVLAVFIPEFTRNVHASRLAEPLEGLGHISAQASMHAASNPTVFAYPVTAPRTPARVPPGKAVTDPAGTWAHPTWRLLDFEMTGPHFFSFEFESHRSDEGSHFIARAFGDLDGDGELSQFQIYGESLQGGDANVYPVRIYREVE